MASLVTLPFIKARMQASRPTSTPTTPRRLQGELGEGLAWTWRQPFLRYSAFFAAAVNILLQILTLGLIVLARHDGSSSAQIGLIVGCMGVGGLVGAFAAPWFQRRIPAGIIITGTRRGPPYPWGLRTGRSLRGLRRCRGRGYGSGGRLTALRVRCRSTPTRPVP